MKITIVVEGKTEKAFIPFLRNFLKLRLQGTMPKLDTMPYNGPIPKGDKLKRVVANLLSSRRKADHVIALTDVYTGSTPPDFVNASDAKQKMRKWVGSEPRFHPHAAQHDFEAWLLPYWLSIQRLARHKQTEPSGNPEQVNHHKPPAHRIEELFRIGKCRGSYVKPRDAGRILRDNDLAVSINACSELKAFVNTIISVCGGTVIL
ncbi:DUF4276 family protein [Desulfococcaceae bacterium HSG9]|nr:DUF4276 family protein [Desulfococcaceae bacterium HSG9]